MSIKQIKVCDCCGKELKDNSEDYHVDLRTSNFMDAAGDTDYNIERVDLCIDCAKSVVESIKRIGINLSEQLKENNNKE